ncbi:MAG TPA: hypothetical protein DDY93_03005, partial [Dehalococcoidia bacterium]|nr:hypothetical protein [Dehalococcoidia bacterium]
SEEQAAIMNTSARLVTRNIRPLVFGFDFGKFCLHSLTNMWDLRTRTWGIAMGNLFVDHIEYCAIGQLFHRMLRRPKSAEVPILVSPNALPAR